MPDPEAAPRGAGAWPAVRRAFLRVDAALPIAVKLAIPIATVAIVGGGFLCWSFYHTESTRIRDEFAQRAVFVAQSVGSASAAQDAEGAGQTEKILAIQRHVDARVALEATILRIDVYGVGGLDSTIVASSDHSRIGTSQVNDDKRAPLPKAGEGATVHVHDDLHEGTNAIHAQAVFASSGAPITVEVLFSPRERDTALAGLRRSFVFGTGAATAIAVITLALCFRFLVLARVQRLLRATDRMAHGDMRARVSGVPDFDAHDEMLRLGARFNGMADAIEELNAELERAATTDQLTGMYNRRYVLDALDREIARAQRTGTSLALAMVDIDGLKTINDQGGHTAGDAAIRGVANGLLSALRGGDFAARVGGDEFIAVLTNCDAASLAVVLERIQAAASNGTGCAGNCPTVSVGGALLRHGDDAVALIHRADEAMYRAKRDGRNTSRLAA